MKELYDIKGYWKISSGSKNYDCDTWEGQLILYEDNWFEGIVLDKNSPSNVNRFIFGIYFAGKLIELFKVVNGNIDVPLRFHCEKDFKEVDDDLMPYNDRLKCEYPVGTIYITTSRVKNIRETVSEEQKELDSKIIDFKCKMDDECRKYYYEYSKLREKSPAALLQEFYKEKELNNEIEPIRKTRAPKD